MSVEREPEHEGWREMTDREMLSYAYTILSKVERSLWWKPRAEVLWAEVATAKGHLWRRLSNPLDEGRDE